MNIKYITEEVNKLILKYGETDPWKLAAAMGVRIIFRNNGTGPRCFKGLFLYQSRIKCIVINAELPDEFKRVILAHELGHCVLHLKESKQAAFHETRLFDNSQLTEYEANIFASELLLPDEKVLEVLNEDSFFSEAACKLCVPQEMLDFKFRILKRKGFKVESPFTARSDFLKNISLGQNLSDFR